jgi:hypothetical protein
MNKNQKVLELYRQRKSEGLTALALACGYAELFLEGLFGDLTPDQQKFIGYISQAASKAIAFWCALDIDPEIIVNLPSHDFIILYESLRNEGLTQVSKMRGFAGLLLEEGLTDKQSKMMKLVIQQCKIIQECWWYPAEYELRLNEEER